MSFRKRTRSGRIRTFKDREAYERSRRGFFAKINKRFRRIRLQQRPIIDKQALNQTIRNKKRLRQPANLDVTNKGKTIIMRESQQTFSERFPEGVSERGFTKSQRKSFRELTKEDLDREYSATIDFAQDGDFRDIDIRRGKTGKEKSSKIGRATVSIRLDESDEIKIHNHPEKKDSISVNWNRPSGGDISNIIWTKVEKPAYSLRHSYIHQPDGRLVRYRVINEKIATKKYKEANAEWKELQAKFNKHIGDPEKLKTTKFHRLSKRYFGGVDWKIETKYSQIFSNENNLTSKKRIESKKLAQEIKKLETFNFKVDVKLGEQSNKLFLIPEGKRTKEQNQKILEIDSKRINNFDNFLKQEKQLKAKYRSKKNPKFMEFHSSKETLEEFNRRNKVAIYRRSFNEWKKWLLTEWGVEVKRMPKTKQTFSLLRDHQFTPQKEKQMIQEVARKEVD